MTGSSGRTSNRDNGFVERERRAYGGRTPWPPGSRPTAMGHERCAAAGHAWCAGGAHGNGTRMVRGWRDTSKKGGGLACDCHGSNGGRARCPHRAARVMRVCNGEGGKGAGGRRGAHGTRDAKPRTAVGSPHRATARRRGGATREARRRGRRGAHGARDAKPRTAPMARRRDGDIAPYRNETRACSTRRGSRERAAGCARPLRTAARWGHRALPPLCTRNSHRH